MTRKTWRRHRRAGTRACIGRNISLQMQEVAVATLLYRYEFALPSPGWEVEYEEWFNPWPLKPPLKV
ncbi:hypothetical protein DL766_008869 [Monosporascus sp. MC13-8B]|uniref:Cytochrome P450 n=1 Tax=Monosporascus cannonballus TaxID=155416 RepID=A0ABY0GYP7_9PEZI|nr:hypothetical protein DL762_007894 [Monosporascus cannonballus]RYO92460.1 hypothetical protein DL763_004687 [Monosporascus cannonballus]RYP17594.1 hypothetical protein DL766_008869 [Monosporascus sp. MC13-8B]